MQTRGIERGEFVSRFFLPDLWLLKGLLVGCFGTAAGAWAAAGARGQLVESEVLRRLAQKGLECKISNIYFKRSGNSPRVFKYRPEEALSSVSSEFDDNRFKLRTSDFLRSYIGFFEFDVKRLQALSRDFLYVSFYESGVTRKLEIKFATGVGYFTVESSYGGFLNNPKESVRQEVYLERCRLL